jgi:hypothetical protein
LCRQYWEVPLVVRKPVRWRMDREIEVDKTEIDMGEGRKGKIWERRERNILTIFFSG